VAVLEPPKPEYDPGLTAWKGLQNAGMSALIVAAIAVVTALASDATLMAKLPPWATPVISFAATAFVNWLKNRNNPASITYTTPPLAR